MLIEDINDQVSTYDTEDSNNEAYEYDTEPEDAKYDGDDYSGAPTGISTIMEMNERIYTNDKMQKSEPTVMDSMCHDINTMSWCIDPAMQIAAFSMGPAIWAYTLIHSIVTAIAHSAPDKLGGLSSAAQKASIYSVVCLIIMGSLAALGILLFTTPVPNILPDCWHVSATVGQSLPSTPEAPGFPSTANDARHRVHVFIAFDEEGNSYCVGVDTLVPWEPK